MAGSIAEWLDALGLARYAQAFADNEIDLAALPHLTEQDLKEIGVALGPRRTLLAAIAALGDGSATAAAGALTDRSRGAAERRQLTVMFCDLAGSTALSTRLDPEDYRHVIRAYQDTCAGVIARYDGYVAKFMGDGVLAYFGWPRGHENDAERAISAGLDVIAAVRDIAPPDGEDESLAVRVGIATGPVVVGDIVGEGAAQEAAVTGETPNLAARLQAVAAPNTIVVAASTQALAGRFFDYAPLGEQRLKGIADPVHAYAVTGARAVESRFAARSDAVLPMVGRDQELALLLERWSQAKAGEGQGVLLVGEAGIGKSRIVRGLFDSLADEAHVRVHYQCSPFHTDSALWPVVQQLQHAAEFDADETDAARLGKLEAVLARANDPTCDIALIADLVGLAGDGRSAALDLAPAVRRARTLETLVRQIVGLAAQTPVLLVLEDAHWVDPTTLEMIANCLGAIADAPALMVLTSRPDNQPELAALPHVTQLALNRLGRAGVEQIVARLGGERLPRETVDAIIARADGVPLYVEELTKALLETGEAAIPASLHDSLMARLDRIPEVKEIAQIAACIGREFDHALLSHIVERQPTDLDAALERLAAAELIFRRGAPSAGKYLFKHALVRDAAYESLLRERRRVLHGRILGAIEEHFPEAVEVEPELLARHAEQAGHTAAAAGYWLRAGQKAAQNSANTEAVSHLRAGLRLLAVLPEDDARDRLELDLLISLGPALMATAGWDAADVDRVYSRARLLARTTNRPDALFPAIWGLWLVAHAGGAVVRAGELLREVIELADTSGERDLLLQAHHAGGSEMCSEGHFEQASQHIDAGIALYQASRHADQALHYGGHDPCVCAHSLGALAHLLMGSVEAAERFSRGALDMATRVEHRPSVAHADLYRAELCQLIGRGKEVRERAERVAQVAQAFSLAHYAAWSKMFIGWSQSAAGDTGGGLALVEDGLADLRTVGIRYHLVHRLSLWVAALAAAGAVEATIDAAEECLATVEETGERWFEPEALRILAVAKARHPNADKNEVCGLLRRSLASADTMGANFWALRSAVSLAQVDGARKAAREILAPICQRFPTDADLPDLKTARAILYDQDRREFDR